MKHVFEQISFQRFKCIKCGIRFRNFNSILSMRRGLPHRKAYPNSRPYIYFAKQRNQTYVINSFGKKIAKIECATTFNDLAVADILK